MSSNGNGRIHLLTEKQAAKLGRQNITMDEATELAQRVAVQVAEHYMAQVPALVGQIVEAALTAYDKTVREHAAVTSQPPGLDVSAENRVVVSPSPETLPVTSGDEQC